MQVLYASSATLMHVRFTQNLAVNKYKTAPLFRKTLQNYCFLLGIIGKSVPIFVPILSQLLFLYSVLRFLKAVLIDIPAKYIG